MLLKSVAIANSGTLPLRENVDGKVRFIEYDPAGV